MPYADKNSPKAKAVAKKASRDYYARNRETEIARSAAYNKKNRDRVNKNAVVRRSSKKPPAEVLWWNARNRAKASGIEFTLNVSDIRVPTHCPVLGIPLAVGTGSASDGSPSIDRIDPAKGYVQGNICVISHKANTIKSNATVEEVRAVLKYMESQHG